MSWRTRRETNLVRFGESGRSIVFKLEGGTLYTKDNRLARIGQIPAGSAATVTEVRWTAVMQSAVDLPILARMRLAWNFANTQYDITNLLDWTPGGPREPDVDPADLASELGAWMIYRGRYEYKSHPISLPSGITWGLALDPHDGVGSVELMPEGDIHLYIALGMAWQANVFG